MSGYLVRLKAANSKNALPDALPKLPEVPFDSNDSSSSGTFSNIEAANDRSNIAAADRWTVRLPDDASVELIFSEALGLSVVQSLRPDALTATPTMRATRSASAPEAGELHALIGQLLDDPAEQAEALRVALGDPIDALRCYRALVEERCDDSVMVSIADESMRTCADCANLSPAGRCLAAQRGESFGAGIVMGRHYSPQADRPLRCLPYKPRPSDADQRTGVERWPMLAK